ncbi:unnamed protein product [Larinioides sclopetarius]|uniref:RNA-directed DNA polymerase n=1 Tax=Larinioides sclopetarius TaxID=280406 RepID=A0AAV2BRY3_9ARAC
METSSESSGKELMSDVCVKASNVASNILRPSRFWKHEAATSNACAENRQWMEDIFQDKEKCAHILLNSIGASNYNILASLFAPKPPNELPYDDLMKVLENHLAPKRSCLVSQHYFLSTYQKEDSSISDYVADLRRDIADCEFSVTCECSKNVSVADIFLRAQFLRGIKDSWIKEQLLQSELTDFNALVDKAIALETSKIDGRELSESTTTTIDDINKVSKRSLNRQYNDIKTSFRNRNTNQRDFATNYRSKSKKPSLDFEKLGINNLCLRCGHNSHLSRDCRSNPNNLKCKACKSTGHVQKVFEQKVGCVPNFTINLKLRNGAKPSYTPSRNVPYALREQVNKELDSLEAAGIISKSVTSDWGSPLVVIPKRDGTLRLCVDYKVGVNDLLMNVNYPIKKIDEVFNNLRDSKYFCKLDLFKAYLHLQTDEESSIIQTISTHRGTYKMNRLSFGIKTAPAEFNRVIDQILNGLPNTIAYFDDIVVHGHSDQHNAGNVNPQEQYGAVLWFAVPSSTHQHRERCNRLPNSGVRPLITSSLWPQPRNVKELRQFLVKFKRGLENQNVDCLSITPFLKNCTSADTSINEEVHQIYASTIFEVSTEILTADAIIQETVKDPELAKIKQELLSNSIDSDYFLHCGILFKNNRIVIPKTLQPMLLKELHSTHIGITKMKQLARRYCIWKNIDKDIETLVKYCKDCSSVKHSPAKAPIHHWDLPINNWDRIHIDYAGTFQGFHYLIVVDAKSRWVEIKVLQRSPDSEITMKLLNDIFATHGYPLFMVSDNASIFTSEEFKHFCRMNEIRQKFIAPSHPATNGLAERNVQTLKGRLKLMSSENVPINLKVQRILFRYRATPLANGKSPAEMYLNRKIRIRLDAMFPFCERKSEQLIKPSIRIIKVGERLDDGREVKRHINQMQKSGVQNEEVISNAPTSDLEPFLNQECDPGHYQFIKPSTTQRNRLITDRDLGDSDQQRRSTRVRRPPALSARL